MPFGVCTPHGLRGCHGVTGQNDGEASGPLQRAGLVKAIRVSWTPGRRAGWLVFKPNPKMENDKVTKREAKGKRNLKNDKSKKNNKWTTSLRLCQGTTSLRRRRNLKCCASEPSTSLTCTIPMPLRDPFFLPSTMSWNFLCGKLKPVFLLLLSFENWKWLKGTRQGYLWYVLHIWPSTENV